ncbi:MAG: S26 family signal peptidase [Thermoanaerobaculia bacterium]
MIDNSAFPLLCTELLRSGQSVRFRATGASMGPAILDGDMVTIAPVALREVRRGDVILYTSDRGLTAHRVVEFQMVVATFITMGDTPGSPREQVGAGAVLGRVESVERDGIAITFGWGFRRRLARLIVLAKRLATRLPLEISRKCR